MAIINRQRPIESLPIETIETVWNDGDVTRLDEFAHEEYVRHDPSYDEPIYGIDGYTQVVTELRTAMPDLTVTPERVAVLDDEFVFTEFTVTGTHDGVFQGIPPTGRSVQLHGVSRVRVVDGLAKEERMYYDTTEFRRQLGLTFPAILGHVPKFARYYIDRFA